MEKEKCLVLLKEDCIRKKLIGKVISMIEEASLDIIAMKLVIPDRELIGRHYPDSEEWLKSAGNKKIENYKKRGLICDSDPISIGKLIREELINHMSNKPIIAIVASGFNAISHLRKLAGTTEPIHADLSTIRGRFSTDSYELADSQERPIENVIHVSDSLEASEREIKIWFPEFVDKQ